MSRFYEWATDGISGSWHDEPCPECDGKSQPSQLRTPGHGPCAVPAPQDQRSIPAAVRLWWFADRNDGLCACCRKDWDEEMMREMERLVEREERAQLLADEEDEA